MDEVNEEKIGVVDESERKEEGKESELRWEGQVDDAVIG